MKKKHEIIIIFLFTIICTTSPLFSQKSNIFGIYAKGGGNIIVSDYSNKLLDYNFSGGMLFYLFSRPSFGIGLVGDYSRYIFQGQDYSAYNYGYFKTNSNFFGGGIFLEFGISDVSRIKLIGKAGMLVYNVLDGKGHYKPNNHMYDNRIFTIIPTLEYNAMVSDNISLNIGAEAIQPFNDYLDDVNSKKWDYAVSLYAGLTIYFTRTYDHDNDGVPDDIDHCPNTPIKFNSFIDEHGCIIDVDYDGIPDKIDLCPHTSYKYINYVGENGCIIDSDRDGIPDAIDKCKHTPANLINFVDSSGCAIDSDNDGIPDAIDKCKYTPSNLIRFVDSSGCVVDSDNDGIPDAIDKCPNTNSDYIYYIDSTGCILDSDKDGIPDALDLCPHTNKKNIHYVNKNGCLEDIDGDGFIQDDKCPNKAEIFNFIDDEDGCPDEAQYKMITTLSLSPSSFFTENSISEKAQETLFLTVISALQDYPDVYWIIKLPSNNFEERKNLIENFITENFGVSHKYKFQNSENNNRILFMVDQEKAREIVKQNKMKDKK